MAKKGKQKKLVVNPTPAGSYFRIEYEGGGAIPTGLEGLWTDSKLALLAITRYHAGLPIVKLALKGNSAPMPVPETKPALVTGVPQPEPLG